VADLQFDRAEPLQGRPGLTCTNCGREIADSYFEVNGKVVCAPCRNVVEDQWNRGQGSSTARFGKALGLGLLAAIGSAVVWYAVTELTDTRWGILAVGVGLAIGTAVSKGANGRGGWRYQTLAVFLTYTAIASSYAPYVAQGFQVRFYATPILVGIQRPISLFILGIALYEAWKLNEKAELRITGPYQVAGRVAPA
jgi:hypothetical protein